MDNPKPYGLRSKRNTSALKYSELQAASETNVDWTTSSIGITPRSTRVKVDTKWKTENRLRERYKVDDHLLTHGIVSVGREGNDITALSSFVNQLLNLISVSTPNPIFEVFWWIRLVVSV